MEMVQILQFTPELLGLQTLSIVQYSREQTVSETGRFSPVIEVSSFGGNQQSTCLLLPHLRTETDLVSEMLWSLQH
jgi:hypothetical protein